MICKHLLFLILSSCFKKKEDICFQNSATHNNVIKYTPTSNILQHHTKAISIHSFSSSVFSGTIDTAGSVTNSVWWAFTQMFAMNFQSVICFSPVVAG